MAPQTGTAVLVIAAFILPGFVTVLLRERTYHVRAGTESFELLLTALYYSATIYLGAACVAVIISVFTDLSTSQVKELWNGDATLAVYAGLAVAGLVIGPATITIAGKRWTDSKTKRSLAGRLRLDPSHSTRSAWEHWFAQRQACLVRATLDDGRVVGGFYGTKSMAGYSRDGQDIFIEERWILDEDGWFKESSPSSLGLYIPGSQIVSLEVYGYPDGVTDDRVSS
jgi:hypothetical protein